MIQKLIQNLSVWTLKKIKYRYVNFNKTYYQATVEKNVEDFDKGKLSPLSKSASRKTINLKQHPYKKWYILDDKQINKY